MYSGANMDLQYWYPEFEPTTNAGGRGFDFSLCKVYQFIDQLMV